MLEDGGLAPPQACVAESSACITLESAGSSVPNATNGVKGAIIEWYEGVVQRL